MGLINWMLTRTARNSMKVRIATLKKRNTELTIKALEHNITEDFRELCWQHGVLDKDLHNIAQELIKKEG